MTSQAKILANRKNAQRSTGPRTGAGKLNSRRNARKHGLSVSLDTNDPTVEELTAVMTVVSRSSEEAWEIVRSMAKQRCELMRAQQTRVDIINRHMPQNDEIQMLSHEQRIALAVRDALPEIKAIDRYEKRAFSQLKKTLRKLDG